MLHQAFLALAHAFQRRELERGDRRLGLACRYFDRVYAFRDYDQRIDSTHRSAGECARLLVRRLETAGP